MRGIEICHKKWRKHSVNNKKIIASKLDFQNNGEKVNNSINVIRNQKKSLENEILNT